MNKETQKPKCSAADFALSEEIELIQAGIMGALGWTHTYDEGNTEAKKKYNFVYDMLTVCKIRLQGDLE